MEDKQSTLHETEHAREAATERKWRIRPGSLVACALLLFLIVLPYCAWSIMGERITEVDVNSGRLRVRTEVLRHPISEDVVEWPFSVAVAKHGLATGTPDYKFAWSTPVGLRKIMGEPDAVGKYGYVLADLRGAVRFAERHNRAMLEAEPSARLLQLLKDADDDGIREFSSQFVNTNGR